MVRSLFGKECCQAYGSCSSFHFLGHSLVRLARFCPPLPPPFPFRFYFLSMRFTGAFFFYLPVWLRRANPLGDWIRVVRWIEHCELHTSSRVFVSSIFHIRWQKTNGAVTGFLWLQYRVHTYIVYQTATPSIDSIEMRLHTYSTILISHCSWDVKGYLSK